MTEAQFQTYLHSLYQGDTSTPEEGDEDYSFRRNLLITSIHGWDNEPGIFWAELWKMNSAGQSAQTTNGVTTSFATPTDFRFPGGFVRILDAAGRSDYYEVQEPHKVELYKNLAEKIAWFTGNKKDGFTLNFLQAPATGGTVEYPYYADPFEPSAAAHVIQMADPWYAVYTALAKLHELDGEGDRSVLALQNAQERMKNMRIRNVSPVWFQNRAIEDQGFDLGVGGFGR